MSPMPSRAQSWLLVLIIGSAGLYFARRFRRGNHDRNGRNALMLLGIVAALLVGAAFLPGNIGLVVFAAGFVLLVVGGRVIRRQGRSQRS